jgi:threonine aldolase
MKIVDLRSDTVTLPTEAMREAIYKAEVGDDVFGEDPTVKKLEKMSAKKMGKEAALFVASGTMANLVSILTHCGRGDEVILGDQCHSFLYEAGGIAALGDVHPFPLQNQPDGTMKLDQIRSAIRSDNVHFPRTKLICLENTHNRCFGSPLHPEYMAGVYKIAEENNLAVHLDGARIFNAATALGVDVKKFTRYADSVAFCLSKGLSAPVGSVICGKTDFIKEARRIRKMVGVGMRQAGIIAAAGIVALEQMTDRLADDHRNARRLAEGIAQIKGLSIDLSRVQTNIIYFGIENCRIQTELLIKKMSQKGILFLSTGPDKFRMVTHCGIEAGDIEKTLTILQQVMKKTVAG